MKQITENEIYKHYIAVDWSKVNFAMASIRDSGTKFKVVEHPPDLKILKDCLKKLPGKKILTFSVPAESPACLKFYLMKKFTAGTQREIPGYFRPR